MGCRKCAPDTLRVYFITNRSSKMGILEKISEIEKEIARTQKNKGDSASPGSRLAPRDPTIPKRVSLRSDRISLGSFESETGQISIPIARNDEQNGSKSTRDGRRRRIRDEFNLFRVKDLT